jgi:hypothetical protein
MRDEINNLREQKNKLENGIVKYIDKNNIYIVYTKYNT